MWCDFQSGVVTSETHCTHLASRQPIRTCNFDQVELERYTAWVMTLLCCAKFRDDTCTIVAVEMVKYQWTLDGDDW